MLWFQHFHKAAGSTVVHLAQLNGLRLFPLQNNGNPKNRGPGPIPLWAMGEPELRKWLARCREMGVEFIATEWGCMDFAWLAEEGITCFTVIRDPFTRLISNYNHILLRGGGRKTGSIEAFHYSADNLEKPKALQHARTNAPNYYTHMLARTCEIYAPVEEDDYRRALDNMQAIRHCFVLEEPDWLVHLASTLGWNHHEVRQNVNESRRWSLRRRGLGVLMRQGRWADVFWRATARRARVDASFRARFEALNKYDILLYQEARRLHRRA